MVRRSERDFTRERLLNRLGYFKDFSSNGGISTVQFKSLERRGSTVSLDSGIARNALRSGASFQEKLRGEDVPSAPQVLAPTESKIPGSTGRVQFSQVVSGVEIPSRHQYSSRIKRTMWADRAEIGAMVERNIVEFEAEGYDWRNVVLDQDMYVNEASGELIHPCHYCANDYYEEKDEHYFPPLQRHSSMA